MNRIFLPQDGYVWFVESTNSQRWVTEYDNCLDEDCLTDDPLQARAFKTEMRAKTFMITNDLFSRFIATEHEFIDG